MESLRNVFHQLRRAHRKAVIPFVMGGDPNLTATAQVLQVLANAGADCLEVGIPFSDPLADGPTIQRASSRALAAGTTPAAVLAMVGRVARRVRVPVVILSYWNPVVQFGRRGMANEAGPFFREAARCGVSGLIVPDLPPDEANGLHELGRSYGIATIFLAAPTSPAHRLRQIARASEGFIYYVSLAGTTGARRQLPLEWLHGVRQLKLLTTKPICVGFGISTPAQARAVGRVADGVIVGSALLNALEPLQRQRWRWLRQAAVFVERLRRAL